VRARSCPAGRTDRTRHTAGPRVIVCSTFLMAAFVSSVLGTVQPAPEFAWSLPKGFPVPAVPADNPMSDGKVELGRHLFYDLRLSGNGGQSCATCHQQERAFTDGLARSAGSTGVDHPRNSMSLVNVAYAATLTWANPSLTRLEDQALVPMFGKHPIELGLGEDREWLDVLGREPRYAALFKSAFPEDDEPFTRGNVLKALATFQRTIISARSPYDRYHFDRDDEAVSDAAKRGEVLFHSQPLSCFTCHGGFNLSGATITARSSLMATVEFHNTGLYNLPGLLSYPEPNTGIYEVTRNPRDVGKFKAPTLRNIAVTAPYMHDGSVASLEDVLAHYEAGGRTVADGLYKGVGHDNPNKSARIRGFTLTPEERSDLIAFLNSLTDKEMLRDSRWTNPWRR
jgi:cytochrome c peroxidase